MTLRTTVAVKNNMKNEEIKSIFELLKSGNENIKLSKNKDVVLILGNTGAGKSTLTYFLAGNGDSLISKEVNPDSGEYIIEDTNNKVSSESTIISKTLYPDLVFDPETRTGFYDCPGFVDTRSAGHDISATYFVKKVIDFSRKVKLVFVVNHTSVRKGVDRNDFMLLVHHATNLLKNIDKFKNSIALVVTKVDNSYVKKGKTWKLVPDEAIITSIVSFLQIVKQDIFSLSKSSTSNSDKQEFYMKALQFIDILLESDGERYKRIGLFRRPDDVGPLSKIKLLQDGKTKLKNMIHKDIFFAQNEQYDFGYSISAESKNYIYDLGEEINKSISSELALIGDSIQKYFEVEEKHITDIYELYEKFTSGINMLSEVEVMNINEERGFIKDIIKRINDLDINISKENVLNIINYFSYLKFLSDVSKKAIKNQLQWSQGLTGIIDYLKKSQKWYNFLINLHEWLSDYTVQQNIKQYWTQASQLIRQCNIGENDKIKVNETDLSLFLEQINIKSNEHNIKNMYNSLKDHIVNQFKLEALKRVLTLTLNHEVQILCENHNKLVIKGQYVKLSDINSEKQCPEKIRFVEILAMNKVFINTDVYKIGEKLQMSIIAPTWDIIGEREIVLDGKPGASQGKASNGYYEEAPGVDGQPGLPGGASGSFMGVAGSVVGGQVHISANGGRGGPGQDGGDGADGKRGHDGPKARDSATTTVFNQWGPEYDWEADNVRWKTRKSKDEYIVTAWYYYTAQGTLASKGGDGGNGGVGGKGGSKGMINIVDLSKSKQISTTNDNGAVGLDGRGGEGGASAENGYSRDAECQIIRFIIIATTDCGYDKLLYAGKSLPGKPGSKGFNFDGRSDPEDILEFVKPSFTINSFKNYLIENLPNSVHESVSIDFQNKFELMDNVTDLYDTLGLMNELQILENNFHNLDENRQILLLYGSLLGRIYKYSIKPKESEKTIEYKKVLNNLYIATLSKLCCSGINAKSYMILDIPKYFDIVVNNIKTLKTIKNDVAINNHKEQFISEIESHIINANHILNSKVIPETKNIFEEMESKIQVLINDTYYMIQETEEEKEIFFKKQQQLERSLVLRMLLGPVNMIGDFLGFLGPAVEDIIQVINGSTDIFETLNLGVHNSEKLNLEPFLSSLISIVEKVFGNISDEQKNKAELLVTQLSDVGSILLKFLGVMKNGSEDLNDTYNKIQGMKEGLSNTIENKIVLDSPNSVEGLRNEASKMLGNHKELFTNLEQSADGELKNNLKIVQQFLNITDISTETYRRIRDDQLHIQSVGETLNSLREKKRKLQEFERNIYNIIIPKCKELRYTFKNFKNSLSNKHHFELEIKKWEIQKTIKDIKFEIEKLTSVFEVGEELSHCLEKLIEATSYFINIFDLIDDYKDKAKLAAYIAHVSSSTAMRIKINNHELRSAMTDLDVIIKSNLVLEEYNRAMEAFIQYIFPFAHLYLDQYNLPSSLALKNGTDCLLDMAVQKIEHLQSSIQKSTISINDYDEYVHKNIKFTSKIEHLSPFYVWKSGQNKNTIKKLLNGGEVTIKSDVTKGSAKNAVKFNTIGLYFKASNETIQSNLDEDLENFQVIMTHSGNSFFKCGNKYYIITSDPLTFTYHMMKDKDGQPIDKNVVYDKVKSSDYMLSPYAMWNIQLYSETLNYNSLRKYENEIIDLELEGLGEYIEEDEVTINVCNKRMEEYYKVDESLSEMESISVMLEDMDSGTIPQIHVRMQRDVHNPPMTNSAPSSFKSSFLNNMCSSVIVGLSILKNLNPFSKLRHWTDVLSQRKENENNFLNSDNFWVNQEQRASEKSSLNELIDNSSLITSSNLLLWDLVLRKYIRKKHKTFHRKASQCELENREQMSQFSHRIAYSYYAPTDESNVNAHCHGHDILLDEIQFLSSFNDYIMDQKLEISPRITSNKVIYLIGDT